jgi:hypothetical protein
VVCTDQTLGVVGVLPRRRIAAGRHQAGHIQRGSDLGGLSRNDIVLAAKLQAIVKPPSDSTMGEFRVTPEGQPTCGQGLAANAFLPAKLAEVLAARAEVLERHMQALDRSDPQAQQELEAYAHLAHAHRDVASELSRLAQEMAGYRDLPMARHDLAVMASPEGQMADFRRFVAVEQELLTLLQANLEAEETSLR